MALNEAHRALLTEVRRRLDEVRRDPNVKNADGSNYWGPYVTRAINARQDDGPALVAYIKSVLRKSGESQGWNALLESGRLDLSFEEMVLNAVEPIRSLFSDEDREIAARLLGERDAEIDRRNADVSSQRVDAPRCWCLLANPATYDVEGALASAPVVLWNIGRIRKTVPQAGDHVLVWRPLGTDGRRGLIGRGIVDGDVGFVPDDDPFWVDAARGLKVEPRVPIRWSPLVQPVWLDDSPEVLGARGAGRPKGVTQPGVAHRRRGPGNVARGCPTH